MAKAKEQPKPIKTKLKRGDRVKVIAGSDKGSTGKVLMIDKARSRLVVEGVNMITKHQKSDKSNQTGGIVRKEAPIHISNVMFMDGNRPSRLGYEVDVTVDGNGVRNVAKRRIAKATANVID